MKDRLKRRGRRYKLTKQIIIKQGDTMLVCDNEDGDIVCNKYDGYGFVGSKEEADERFTKTDTIKNDVLHVASPRLTSIVHKKESGTELVMLEDKIGNHFKNKVKYNPLFNEASLEVAKK